MDLTPEKIRTIVEQVTRELATREGGAPDLAAGPGMGRSVGRAFGSRAPLEGYSAVNVGPGSPAGSAFPALPDPSLRANFGPTSPRGIFSTLDAAVAAAEEAHFQLVRLPLAVRARALEHIRAKMRANVRLLAELAVSETGMGRVDDKIKKNLLVINQTPGLEDLEPHVYTGDHGLTLTEWAPYGVIGAAGPSTNPSETVINNGISMIAGGNAVVFAAHPSAKRICQTTVSLIDEAMVEAGGPENIITTVSEPTIESAQAMMAHPKTRILVVTGGPGVVQAALASKKKVIAGGPGNPPVVVDETADIAGAAADIVAGASLDNNVICTDEKEVFVVTKVADALLQAMARSGAYVLQPYQVAQIERAVLSENRGPRKYSPTNKKFVGKDASVILKEIGVSVGPEVRLIVADVPPDHPFVWTELLMPVLGVARVQSADEGMDWAVLAEHGFRHTASMHSKNVERLSKMARMMDCSIFVKNGPNYAGLGMGGEGPTSFTIASPTGEGMTTARTFTRRRRCTLVDLFRIV
ncbi:MAG: aldehyde dehydrogenase family protein [Candidatus Eiseniibacteriota bacterium]